MIGHLFYEVGVNVSFSLHISLTYYNLVNSGGIGIFDIFKRSIREALVPVMCLCFLSFC